MFQRCEVPLVWWPWWPFNAADVYMGSLLPLERMLREGAVDGQVRLVPVLDGFRLPQFYHWWFGAFFTRKVRLLLSDIERALHLQVHAGHDVNDVLCSLGYCRSRRGATPLVCSNSLARLYGSMSVPALAMEQSNATRHG